MGFLSKNNIDELRLVTVVPIGDKVAFKNLNGTWISIQPNGSEESRNEVGPYELATILDNELVMFTTDGTNAYIRKYSK